MRKWLKTTDYLLFDVEAGIARITLNRPEKRNALNAGLLAELRDALLEADDLKAVRVIILEGAGKDFCAGYDLVSNYAQMRKMQAGSPTGNDIDHSQYRGLSSLDDDSWALERMLDSKLTLLDVHKPVIAKVQGNCVAGGTDIALLCDMVIAAEDAKIGFPATRAQGSPPNHMWFYHVGPQWAKRLLLSGDSILGRDAARIGLVMDAVPFAKLEEAVCTLAKRLCNIDSDLLSANKRIVNVALELQGALTIQRMASEMDARAHLSPSLAVWRHEVMTNGLKSAIKTRDLPFGDGLVGVSRSD